MSPVEPLPAGSRLLHVGPHKTGSTALQSAFHQARAELVPQGTRYIGRARHEAAAIRWVTGLHRPGDDLEHGRRRWRAVRRQLRADESHRRFLSSEFLCEVDSERAGRIVEQIGRDQLWIAITLRPLARILASQYQQSLQFGTRVGDYGDWLDRTLRSGSTEPGSSTVWRRHRHDDVVRRWAEHVGPERVVVVVADPRDHAHLPRTFEELFDLVPGTLVDKPPLVNRSMTASELAVLRRFLDGMDTAGLDPATYRRVKKVLGRHLKDRVPGTDEPRLRTPDWAVTRANELAAEMVAAIEASGARIIGETAILSQSPTSGLAEVPATPDLVATDLAAEFAVGLARAAEADASKQQARIEALTSEVAELRATADSGPTRWGRVALALSPRRRD